MGKKTLYLDLDAVEALEAALSNMPGSPSVSSFLTQQLPLMASAMSQMSGFLAPGKSVIDVQTGLNVMADEQMELLLGAKKLLRHIPPEKTVIDVRASKPKRQKKPA
jgi:hypothetical protein